MLVCFFFPHLLWKWTCWTRTLKVTWIQQNKLVVCWRKAWSSFSGWKSLKSSSALLQMKSFLRKRCKKRNSQEREEYKCFERKCCIDIGWFFLDFRWYQGYIYYLGKLDYFLIFCVYFMFLWAFLFPFFLHPAKLWSAVLSVSDDLSTFPSTTSPKTKGEWRKVSFLNFPSKLVCKKKKKMH